MNDSNKVRADAWDATLSEEQRWTCYDLFRRMTWYKLAEHVETEYGVRRPGRNALYNWAARMRRDESAHRIEQSIQAREEVGALANTTATDSKLVDAYKSMATDLALKGNATDAVRFTQMAMAIAAQTTKTRELELKAAAQATKDEALKLAREKFEFSAAKEAIKFADTIKSIVADTSLTDDERIKAVRKTLFGALPPE